MSSPKPSDCSTNKLRRGIEMALHLMILALSVYLIASISLDTFRNRDFTLEPWFVKQEFWICVALLGIFVVEFALSCRKWHFFWTHILYLLVSVPWLMLIILLKIDLGPHGYYWVRFIPLFRGGYALAIVIGWFTYNTATRLFITYLFTIVASIFFASLIGYTYEHGVNPGMTNYQNAIWWAAMNFTTVGSEIVAVTPIGRILSVLLACMGMMMLPVFTIYITDQIQRSRSTASLDSFLPSILKDNGSGDKPSGPPANPTPPSSPS